MATTNDLQNIKKVFGEDWTPSVSSDLQNRGVYGAVRVAGSNDVYTIGSGGTKLTPETYQQTFGTLDQKGIVGEITAEQAAQLGITQNTASPTSVTETIPSDLISAQKATTSDVESLISKRQDLFNQIQNSTNSEEVTALQNQYADMESKISSVENSRDMGLTEAGQKVIPMDVIYGQQQAIEQRATNLLNSYSAQQKNILTRLGFAKEAQALKTQTLKDLLSYTTDDLNIQFKIQDRIDSQISDYQARIDKYNDDQKEQFNNVVEIMKTVGQDFNDLSPEDKGNLITIASKTGIPLAVYQQALSANKNQVMQDRAMQEKMDLMDLAVKQANIAQSYASAAASNRSNRGTSEEELTGLAGALNAAANDIITAEKTGSPMSSSSYWNMVKQFAEAMGMSEADADKQIINTVKQKKGEAINQNLGSDFVAPVTEAIKRANAAKAGVPQSVVTKQIKAEEERIIKSLMASGMSEIQARKTVLASKTKLPNSTIGK